MVDKPMPHIDEEILGSISGYKVADIDDDWNIIKANDE